LVRQLSIFNYQLSMPEASRAARQWSRQARAGIKELRERSGNAEGIASGSSAVSGAGADFKEP
jgi:hypothetical protein